MQSDPYSPLVRRLFAGPEHVAPAGGEPPAGETVSLAGQGVRLRLNAVVNDERVDGLTFRAYGCPHFIAACECLCRQYQGKTLAELAAFKPAEIMQTLAIPVAKTGRILVLEDAVGALVACFGPEATP